jgi:transcriptional regulator with XRE-family HTH domain
MSLRKLFISNLRKIRRASGISQMELAGLCNTSVNYIGTIEMGIRFPSMEMIERIAAALQTKPYEFFLENSPTPVKKSIRQIQPELLRKYVLNQLDKVTRKIRKY